MVVPAPRSRPETCVPRHAESYQDGAVGNTGRETGWREDAGMAGGAGGWGGGAGGGIGGGGGGTGGGEGWPAGGGPAGLEGEGLPGAGGRAGRSSEGARRLLSGWPGGA